MISVILGLENGISHYNLRQNRQNRGQEKACFQKPNRFECLIAGMSKWPQFAPYFLSATKKSLGLIKIPDKDAYMNSPLLEAQKLFSTTQIMGCLLGAAYATDIPASMYWFDVQFEKQKNEFKGFAAMLSCQENGWITMTKRQPNTGYTWTISTYLIYKIGKRRAMKLLQLNIASLQLSINITSRN